MSKKAKKPTQSHKAFDSMQALNPIRRAAQHGPSIAPGVQLSIYDAAQSMWLARAVVRVISSDLTANGWTWLSSDDEGKGDWIHPLDGNDELASIISDCAAIALYEGAGVLLFDDGAEGDDLARPLGIVKELPTVHRMGIFIEGPINTNPFSKDNGLPGELSLQYDQISSPVKLHPSRYYIMSGPDRVKPSKARSASKEWKLSIIARGWEAIEAAHNTIRSASRTAQLNMSVAVTLKDAVSSDGKIPTEISKNIRYGLDAWAENGYIIMPDKLMPGFQKLDSNMQQMVDIVLQQVEFVASAFGIPATKLLGRQSKGLANGGEADLENHYTNMRGYQIEMASPAIRAICKAMRLPAKFEFNSMWQESDKESADAMHKITLAAKEIHEMTGDPDASTGFFNKAISRFLRFVIKPTEYTPIPDPDAESKAHGVLK